MKNRLLVNYCYKNYYDTLQKEFTDSDIERIGIGRGEKRVNILKLYMGLDIETTTIYEKIDDKVTSHFSFCYIWQFQVNHITFIGRTIKDLAFFIRDLNRCFIHLHNERFLCFIHNLPFEFSFLARELFELGLPSTVFAREKRKPMKWECGNIIFLDSYKLTHLPLSKMAKNYCKTQKMVGDLDYNIVRTSKTHLTKKEFRYCRNDVVILSEYAEFYFTEYIENGNMPMTQTMISNLVMKDTISVLKCSQDVFFLMKKAYPKSKEQYDYIMSFYSGAYTHGMLLNLFEKLYDGLSYDVNSEYPYVMMSKYYPMGKFRQLHDLTKIDLFLDKYCCLVDCTLENITSKYGVTILSENKILKSENAVYDNGRLLSAKSVRVHITEIDIQTLRMHYDFRIKYHYCSYTERGYLPKYVRLTIAYLYSMKCLLKGVKGKEREYAVIKEKLNAIYGSMCTKLIFEENFFDSEWHNRSKELDFKSLWKTKNKLPQWAVYVTAHARNLVLTAVYNIVSKDRTKYWYTDTDSIKCKNEKWIVNMFNKMNEQIANDNQIFIKDLNLKKTYPDVDFSILGQFAREDDLQEFKCLGSKRYIYTTYDGAIHQTVAGLPKGVLKNYCKKHNEDIYEFFSDDGVAISDSETQKLCAYYQDTPVTKTITDCDGNIETITAYSYLSLIPTKFNLKVKDLLVNLALTTKATLNDIGMI